MSSVAAPFGLRPIGRLDSGSLEPFRQYPIASGYAANIAVGDVVQLVDQGNEITIQRMTDGEDGDTAVLFVGIFMGCEYTDPTSGQLRQDSLWPTGTVASDAMAYVVADPNVLFEIQADGSITNTKEVYGRNAPIVNTAPNATFKQSRIALDISAIGTTTTDMLKIVDYRGGTKGDEIGSGYPVFVCRFNNVAAFHQLATNAAPAAV
tara:strand:- start:600 stop:1220 length:621 start_codon:yes stop_codon:yes gene_type:complete